MATAVHTQYSSPQQKTELASTHESALSPVQSTSTTPVPQHRDLSQSLSTQSQSNHLKALGSNVIALKPNTDIETAHLKPQPTNQMTIGENNGIELDQIHPSQEAPEQRAQTDVSMRKRNPGLALPLKIMAGILTGAAVLTVGAIGLGLGAAAIGVGVAAVGIAWGAVAAAAGLALATGCASGIALGFLVAADNAVDMHNSLCPDKPPLQSPLESDVMKDLSHKFSEFMYKYFPGGRA